MIDPTIADGLDRPWIAPRAFPVRVMRPAAVPPQLAARSARLWPDSPYLQAEWLRAVKTVRATTRGWLLERPVRKEAGRA